MTKLSQYVHVDQVNRAGAGNAQYKHHGLENGFGSIILEPHVPPICAYLI
jgi:hypothetical protein